MSCAFVGQVFNNQVLFAKYHVNTVFVQWEKQCKAIQKPNMSKTLYCNKKKTGQRNNVFHTPHNFDLQKHEISIRVKQTKDFDFHVVGISI